VHKKSPLQKPPYIKEVGLDEREKKFQKTRRKVNRVQPKAVSVMGNKETGEKKKRTKRVSYSKSGKKVTDGGRGERKNRNQGKERTLPR